MRTNWLALCAAGCLAAGCAGSTATSPSGVELSANGRPESFGSPPVQQVSWTERITAPFRNDPAADLQRNAIAAQKAADRQLAASFGDPATGPPSPALLVSLAEMAAHNGDAPQARQFYQKALAAEPQNVPALLGAARMEDREGRLDLAVMLYERAAAANPNNPTALNDLGLCLARQGRLADAERALGRAVQLEPAKALYRNNMAKVQVELNRNDLAVQHLAAVYPPPVVNYNMGVLLHQRGRSAEAEPFLATAVRLDPHMQPAHVLLAEIRPSSPLYQTARAAQPTPAPTAVGAAAMREPSSPGITPTESSDMPQVIDTGAPAMPPTREEPTLNEPMLLPPIS